MSTIRVTWPERVDRDARRLAAITAAGLLAGLLVGGVVGRLAMMLLAVRNPGANGMISDDGFRIGQLTMSGTLNLLAITTLIGVVGGAIYLVLRHLAVGPPSFRLLSISGGAAVVVGSMLVHADGVDFTVLGPAPLAIALFVAIPFGYVALLMWLGERLLAPGSWFTRAPTVLALLPLLAWIPLLPLVPVLVGGWLVREGVRQTGPGAAMLRHPVTSWTWRLLLAALFAAALVDLIRDVATLT